MKLIRVFVCLIVITLLGPISYAQTGNKVVVVPLEGDIVTVDTNGAVITAVAPIVLGGPTNTEISFDVSALPVIPVGSVPSGIPESKLVSTNISQPSLVIRCVVYLFGIFPSRSGTDAYIGEIGWVGYNFAQRASTDCNGQLIAINQNTALFSLYGTTYGGDGRTTFGLPDMRGRVPVHVGQGPGLPNRRLGERFGRTSIGQ